MELIDVNNAQKIIEDDASHTSRGASMVFRAAEKYMFVGHLVEGKHASSVEPQMSNKATVPIDEHDAGPLNEALLIRDEEVISNYVRKYVQTRSIGYMGFTHNTPSGTRLLQSGNSTPLLSGFNEVRRPARWAKE
jgi:hypothetical protein